MIMPPGQRQLCGHIKLNKSSSWSTPATAAGTRTFRLVQCATQH